MARPAKAINTATGARTKEEIKGRQQIEDKLKGSIGRLTPPKFLTVEQKTIFKKIVKELQNANILGKLDIPILAQTAVTIDRMQAIESKVNENPDLLFDKDLMSVRDKYSKDFFRCCNELSLSPQSRAKMALTAQKNTEEQGDPLLELINGGITK